ncbi:MAG: HDOD domain-containing protein [Pseudomonadota bacterium]
MSATLGQAFRNIIEKKLEDGSLKLPALPSSAVRVMELLRKNELDPKLVVRTLEKDPLLATQVVRASNAVAFRGRMAVGNLGQAVVRLGSRQLRSFLMAAVSLQLFVSKDRELDSAFRTLRTHSLAVSLLARDLAQLSSCEEVEEAYLAGLLHDIGKMVIMVFVLEVARGQRPGRSSAVRFRTEDYMEAMRNLHRPIGAKLVALWDFPPYLQEVIHACDSYSLSKRVSPGNLVCFANATTKRMKLYLGDTDPFEVNAGILIGRSVLGIDEDLVSRVCAGLEDRVKDL